MTSTHRRALDALLAEMEREDPVGEKIASAREHLRQAQRELGMDVADDDRDTAKWVEIVLDDERYRRIASLARERGVSLSTVVREAIDRGLVSSAARV